MSQTEDPWESQGLGQEMGSPLALAQPPVFLRLQLPHLIKEGFTWSLMNSFCLLFSESFRCPILLSLWAYYKEPVAYTILLP